MKKMLYSANNNIPYMDPSLKPGRRVRSLRSSGRKTDVEDLGSQGKVDFQDPNRWLCLIEETWSVSIVSSKLTISLLTNYLQAY